jgi:hypothetical protein
LGVVLEGVGVPEALQAEEVAGEEEGRGKSLPLIVDMVEAEGVEEEAEEELGS